MIAYASRTGTKRNLAALREAGWRLMVSARGVLRTEGFPYALDNGAWTAFQRSEAFDVRAFEKAVALLGRGADFIILPDIVMGGIESFWISVAWLRKLRRRVALKEARFLIAVQDGMEHMTRRIGRGLGPKVGIFVGGSTEWKVATMALWARLAHRFGAICHVGRVNTARRIHACEAAGVDSFDGSSASRFSVTLRPLELARQQIDLEGYLARRASITNHVKSMRVDTKTVLCPAVVRGNLLPSDRETDDSEKDPYEIPVPQMAEEAKGSSPRPGELPMRRTAT